MRVMSCASCSQEGTSSVQLLDDVHCMNWVVCRTSWKGIDDVQSRPHAQWAQGSACGAQTIQEMLETLTYK